MDQGTILPPSAASSGDFVAVTMTAITRFIRENALKPGDRLPAESVLTRELHVSRTVVREALRSLAALRLVDLGAGKRPAVAQLDDKTMAMMMAHGVTTDQIGVEHIYDARRTIESRTAALASLRRTDAEAREMLAHARAMEQDFDEPCLVMEHDIAFHLAIARASRNPVFALVVGAFRGVMHETWPIGWRSRARDEDRRAVARLHVELAEAIAAGDPRTAVDLMNRHFDDSTKALLIAGLI